MKIGILMTLLCSALLVQSGPAVAADPDADCLRSPSPAQICKRCVSAASAAKRAQCYGAFRPRGGGLQCEGVSVDFIDPALHPTLEGLLAKAKADGESAAQCAEFFTLVHRALKSAVVNDLSGKWTHGDKGNDVVNKSDPVGFRRAFMDIQPPFKLDTAGIEKQLQTYEASKKKLQQKGLGSSVNVALAELGAGTVSRWRAVLNDPGFVSSKAVDIQEAINDLKNAKNWKLGLCNEWALSHMHALCAQERKRHAVCWSEFSWPGQAIPHNVVKICAGAGGCSNADPNACFIFDSWVEKTHLQSYGAFTQGGAKEGAVHACDDVLGKGQGSK